MAFFIAVSSLYVIPPDVAEAATIEMKNGEFFYATTVKKATSSVRYRTIGWQLHSKPGCPRQPPSVNDECDPRATNNGPNDIYIVLMGGNIDEEYEVPDPSNPNEPQIYTKFKWTQQEIEDAVRAAGAEWLIQEGGTLYASAVMESVEGPRDNPVRRKGPFYTLQGIIKAEGWAKPSDLTQYFDATVTFKGKNEGYPLTVKYWTYDGTPMRPDDELGNHPAGATLRVRFPETMEYNGQTWEIYYSTLRSKLTGRDSWEQDLSDDNPNNDKVAVRDFTMALGGVDAIGKYRPKKDDDCTTNPNLPGCGGGEDPGNPGGSGSCTWVIGTPSGGTRQTGSVMNPNATGQIAADGPFNVVQGIPTSETTNVRVLGLQYLHQYDFQQMTGQVTYDCTVNVTYVRTWQYTDYCPIPPGPDGTGGGVVPCPKPTSDQISRTYNFTVTRPYSYWAINNVEVFQLNMATVQNYLLPGGSVTLNPSGYTPPTLQATKTTGVDNHVRPSNAPSLQVPQTSFNGGCCDVPPEIPFDQHLSYLRNVAESQIQQPEVKNDRVEFNGSTIMNDSWVRGNAPAPSAIPQPSTIGGNVLYRSGLLVSPSLTNRANNPSSGTIYYTKVSGSIGSSGANPSFPINNINSTTVHTPVVTHGYTSDDKAHDQRVNPSAARNTLVLDRPFSVTLSNHGTHRDIPGYGTQTYTKYIKRKEVLFTFDVYRISDSKYFPANTWIEIPAAQQSEVDFYLPVWVDEGNHTVKFRTIAENAPSDSDGQRNANEELSYHSAYDTVDVYVVGRLYDFRITDISDPVWDDVDKTYYVGARGIDGQARSDIDASDTLPIRAGSHPTYRNAIPKHGYHFKFNVKTKGNMFDYDDGIRITPTFYYVPKTGTNNSHVQPVDLYYHDGNNKFIKIGSDRDRTRLYITLNARDRKVPQSDLQNTAPYFGLSFADYMNQIANRQVYVGKYSWQIIPQYLRTFIGLNPDATTYGINIPPNATADQQYRSLLSVQQWYGQYSLPATLYAVPKGTNIYDNGPLYEDSPIFLRNGYLLVNFQIETLQNGDPETPYLRYYNTPHANQWLIEGFNYTITDAFGKSFVFHNGDVILIDLDASSSGDYGSGITH
jgi:hypothetical protein